MGGKDINIYLEEKREFIDNWLTEILRTYPKYPRVIHDAMEYTVMAGGKRIRPILFLATAEMLETGIEESLGKIGCTLELVHTYSLIHDDLPALDNDDMRRNQPTCHIAYDEATAILTGNALLSLAFEVIADYGQAQNCPGKSLALVGELARASGTKGMIGGQVLDLWAEGREVSWEEVEEINNRKTGALIKAAVRMGGLVRGASHEQINKLSKYGESLGHGFQIADDMLDLQGDSKKMGKSSGMDQARNKATYPLRFGVDKAMEKVNELYQESVAALDYFGEEAAILRELSRLLIFRDR